MDGRISPKTVKGESMDPRTADSVGIFEGESMDPRTADSVGIFEGEAWIHGPPIP